jgi:hypothetical protein
VIDLLALFVNGRIKTDGGDAVPLDELIDMAMALIGAADQPASATGTVLQRLLELINNRVGAVNATGGSASAGGANAKLNALIGTAGTINSNVASLAGNGTTRARVRVFRGTISASNTLSSGGALSSSAWIGDTVAASRSIAIFSSAGVRPSGNSGGSVWLSFNGTTTISMSGSLGSGGSLSTEFTATASWCVLEFQ